MGQENTGPARQDVQARYQRKSEVSDIEPGMNVEATDGDLGEADISKPKVADIARDEQGNVKRLVVEKGVIFKKNLEIPDRQPCARAAAFQPHPAYLLGQRAGRRAGPLLVALILLVGNNRKIMRGQRLGILTNIGLVIALLILLVSVALLIYGLATGQSS